MNDYEGYWSYTKGCWVAGPRPPEDAVTPGAFGDTLGMYQPATGKIEGGMTDYDVAQQYINSKFAAYAQLSPEEIESKRIEYERQRQEEEAKYQAILLEAQRVEFRDKAVLAALPQLMVEYSDTRYYSREFVADLAWKMADALWSARKA